MGACRDGGNVSRRLRRRPRPRRRAGRGPLAAGTLASDDPDREPSLDVALARDMSLPARCHKRTIAPLAHGVVCLIVIFAPLLVGPLRSQRTRRAPSSTMCWSLWAAMRSQYASVASNLRYGPLLDALFAMRGIGRGTHAHQWRWIGPYRHCLSEFRRLTVSGRGSRLGAARPRPCEAGAAASWQHHMSCGSSFDKRRTNTNDKSMQYPRRLALLAALTGHTAPSAAEGRDVSCSCARGGPRKYLLCLH
ncbi:hypothetical protein BD413DRAFT_191745 [Trametes elegans]|nr:hypothetical protein BD413DRAFT_191745 [Trametes elegans]